MTDRRTSKPTASLWVPVAAIIVVPLVFLGGYTLLVEGSKSEVSGTLRLGDETLAVDRCESGVLGKNAPATRPRWHGVDLFAASDPARRVRLIDDPEKGELVTLRRDEEREEGNDQAHRSAHGREERPEGQGTSRPLSSRRSSSRRTACR